MKKRILFCMILLTVGLLFGSCRRGHEAQKQPVTDTVPIARVPVTVNVYIEGSGSIDAYTKGITDFKNVLGSLFVKLKYHYREENLHILWIYNDRQEQLQVTKTTNDNLVDFANRINVELRQLRRGNNTDLNNIFRKIVQQTDTNTISILFSDCIYSIGSGGVIDMVNNGKNLTTDAFLSKSREENENFNLSSIIFRMKSAFDGAYYPYTGDANKYNYQGKRPYYICVFANQNILDDFNKNITAGLEQNQGYENKYVLSSENPNGMYYSVLKNTSREGQFNKDNNNSGSDYIHGISDVKLAHGTGKLTFAVAVDFAGIRSQVDENYILNTENYQVTSDNFMISQVFALDRTQLTDSEKYTIRDHSPTHVVLLQSTVNRLNNTEVSFVLKKQMPQWVTLGNTEDDTRANFSENTTFGLKYWVEGIVEAYTTIYPNNKNYFEGKITIR